MYNIYQHTIETEMVNHQIRLRVTGGLLAWRGRCWQLLDGKNHGDYDD